MKRGAISPGGIWVGFNIVLFSSYALFGVVSFVWPSVIEQFWIALLHFATLAVQLSIVYALLKRIPRTNYLVALVSFLMVLHLLVLLLIPLGMAVVYIGPSRSFYTLFAVAVSTVLGERQVNSSITVFNAAMLLVHVVNVCFFSRRKTAAMFSGKREIT